MALSALSLTGTLGASAATREQVDLPRVVGHVESSCGGSISLLARPTAEFNPLTASPVSLRENGYPQRPQASNGGALAAWTTAMRDAKHYYVPKTVTCQPGHANTINSCPDPINGSSTLPCQFYTENWGGHQVAWTGAENSQAPAGWNGIDYSAADWTVPSTGTYSNPYSFATWTGIGMNPIIQAGVTQDNIGGNGDPSFWFEDYSYYCASGGYPGPNCPVTPFQQSAGPPIAKTQIAYVALDYEGEVDGQLDSIFWLENEHNGQYSYFQTETPYYDKSSAEWIVENHLDWYSNVPVPYIPPMSVPYTGAIYNGPGGTSQPLTSTNNISYICWGTNDGRGITPTGAAGGSFTANSASSFTPCPH